MLRSPLFGRRIHIAGSIAGDPSSASAEDVDDARRLIAELVKELTKRGAGFVVPVDAEKRRAADNQEICFDWLVWRTLYESLALRPTGASNPFAVAVQHHKTEDQIPREFEDLWDSVRTSDIVQIENVSHWNMNSKRMEAQARWGDILIAIGGSEGVLYLANLYHDAGKPVIPLSNPITPPTEGARRLFSLGLSSADAPKLFRTSGNSAHAWMNRINFSKRQPIEDRVSLLLQLLEALEPPRAFSVRLLNKKHPDFAAVQDFFDNVVQPVIEGELGFKIVVVDGTQPYEYATLDKEIFEKLYRSNVVLADITGARPNCFIELGYALGRCLPTMIMAKKGADVPFDITTVGGHHWSASGSAEERRREFREHWTVIQSRPPLVSNQMLVS